ncbi:MAG: hypothetical protein ACTHMS_16740 [Jatrophihabitans sp.]|uniref:hypothetical protein n=1 Tax=Jatrophihabitans sp. TaxID=1932789 RepID=UPI003F7EB27B
MVRLPDGRQVSAVSRSLDSVLGWARRDQQRYAHLPGRVLAVVLDDAVVLHEWTFARGIGKAVATWPRGSFSASEQRALTDQSVRVILPDGKAALLSASRGPRHADARETLRAIAAAGQRSPSTPTSSAAPRADEVADQLAD